MTAPEAERFAHAGDGFGRDDRVGEDAFEQVPIEDGEASLFKARAGGEELSKDVFAGAPFFEHLAQAADLSFDPAEPVEELLVVVDLGSHGTFRVVDNHTPGGYVVVK